MLKLEVLMLFNMKASYKNTFVRVTRYKNTTPAPEAYLLNFNVSFLNAAFFIHKGFTSLSQPSMSSSLFSPSIPRRSASLSLPLSALPKLQGVFFFQAGIILEI